MKDIIAEYIQRTLEFMPAFILSLFGALVRSLKVGKRLKITQYVARLLTGVFVGCLAYLFLTKSDMSNEWKLAIILLSGYCADDLLSVLVKKFIEKIDKYPLEK